MSPQGLTAQRRDGRSVELRGVHMESGDLTKKNGDLMEFDGG